MKYAKFVGPMQRHLNARFDMCITGGMNDADHRHMRPDYEESFEPIDAPDYLPAGGLRTVFFPEFSMACGNATNRNYL